MVNYQWAFLSDFFSSHFYLYFVVFPVPACRAPRLLPRRNVSQQTSLSTQGGPSTLSALDSPASPFRNSPMRSPMTNVDPQVGTPLRSCSAGRRNGRGDGPPSLTSTWGRWSGMFLPKLPTALMLTPRWRENNLNLTAARSPVSCRSSVAYESFFENLLFPYPQLPSI